MASASTTGSEGATRRACSGVRTSRTAGRSLATIGISSAIASSSVLPSPSQRDGNANTSAPQIRSATSSRYPSTRTLAVRPARSIRACRGSLWTPGRPATSTVRSGQRSTRRGVASTSVSCPFCHSSRPMASTTGVSSSSPSRRRMSRRARLGAPTEHRRVTAAGDHVDPAAGYVQSRGHDLGDVGGDRVEPDREVRGEGVGRLRAPELPRGDAGRGGLRAAVGHVDEAGHHRAPGEAGTDPARLVGLEQRGVHEIRAQRVHQARHAGDIARRVRPSRPAGGRRRRPP